MNRFGASAVVAPFYWQPTRTGLRGLGTANTSVYSGPPIGQGAGGGAMTGAAQGAAAGSVAGPIGAAIGAVAGAIGGAIAGSINKTDPEQYNFNQAVALWQVNPNNIYSIGNKYLVLAGLFDLSLKNPHIPIYQKYGRMGEQKFVTDMMNLIYQAAQQGRIGPNDTALTVMSKIVQPWIDSWGFGPMVDPHADLINRLLVGMIQDYVTGNQSSWHAVGGDYPFGNLPAFSLPAPVVAPAPAPAAAPAPSGAIVPVGSAPNLPTLLPSLAPSPAPVLPVTAAPVQTSAPAVIPTLTPTAPSTTVATTSAGAAVTQADLQSMVAQLAAQGQSAQQAYTSALQALQNSGIAPTAAVQSAVQSAVQNTPAPAAATTTAGLSGLGWFGVIAAGATLLLATARPVGRVRRPRARRAS